MYNSLGNFVANYDLPAEITHNIPNQYNTIMFLEVQRGKYIYTQ